MSDSAIASEVAPAENQPATPETTPATNTPAAPPPAAAVVAAGKSEREMELERQLADAAEKQRLAEFKAAELERDNQLLKEIPAPKPEKRRRMLPTVINLEGDDE